MAEFQDVIIQMKRMCAYYSPTCNGCKLCLGRGTSEFCGEQPNNIRSHPALVEVAVMRWAKDHPEPRYPTWGEWLISVGAARKIPTGIPFELQDGSIVDPPWETVVDVNTPIPADIAQKLGLEPKK